MANEGFTLPTSAPASSPSLPTQPPVDSDPAPAAPAAAASISDAPLPSAPPPPSDSGVTRRTESDDVSLSLDELLLELLKVEGSDLHLSPGAPPRYRVHGELEDVPGYGMLTPNSVRDAVYAILTERQKKTFEESRELDLAYELPGVARFRVNVMWQQGKVSAVLRAIPWEILPLEALGMPPELRDMANLPRGLVLVTGPTGSGKSTTLAAVIDVANRTRKGHIVTIEDPIEFVHPHRLCTVNQREVGEDTDSFAEALRHALRQDPDIILVGEMRDLETIATALTAAETGHLVFGTLHTSSAATTIDRIIDVFPAGQQDQIRTQLASSIQAVVCQALCRKADGKGRVAATEVMIATPAVRNLIREGKLQAIPSALQTGSKFGMHTLNQSLADLVEDGSITYETAVSKCSDVSELNQLLGRVGDADE